MLFCSWKFFLSGKWRTIDEKNNFLAVLVCVEETEEEEGGGSKIFEIW